MTSQTPANVADIATKVTKLPEAGLLLLGLFGTNDEPRALIRLASGDTRTIMPGDLVAGKLVAGIDETSVVLAKGGNTYRLSLPDSGLPSDTVPDTKPVSNTVTK